MVTWVHHYPNWTHCNYLPWGTMLFQHLKIVTGYMLVGLRLCLQPACNLYPELRSWCLNEKVVSCRGKAWLHGVPFPRQLTTFSFKHQLLIPGIRCVSRSSVNEVKHHHVKRRIHISKVRNYMFNQWYPITMSLPNCYLHEMEQLGKDIGNGYPLVKHVIPYWCVSSFTCLTWYLLPTDHW